MASMLTIKVRIIKHHYVWLKFKATIAILRALNWWNDGVVFVAPVTVERVKLLTVELEKGGER